MPAPSEEDRFYLDRFWKLSTCRDIGFGVVGPIPYRDIKDEARDIGLDDEARDIFVRVIEELDRVFLAWCEEERKAASKK